MIVNAAALAIVSASIVIALVAFLRTHQLRQAMSFMLDLWVAAGLLRLSQDASWTAIAGAVALIAVRKLVVYSLDSSPVRTPA